MTLNKNLILCLVLVQPSKTGKSQLTDLDQARQNNFVGPDLAPNFLAYRIGISAIFTHVRNFYLTPLARVVPALGIDKKRTDARSAELLLPELLLVVNVNNIRFSDISAKHFDHQENKQTKILRLEFQIYRLFLT